MTDILAIGAHPDDIEFALGGILAKMASMGKSIVTVDLTLGDKGTNGNPELRKSESEKAAKVIGSKRIFLNFSDCEVFDTYDNRLKITRVIREYQPKLILAPIWKGERNHPDHIACGLITRYACWYSRIKKILPELPYHRPDGILHYPSRSDSHFDFLIDVSDHVETWKKMMACHVSQISTHDYISWNLKKAAEIGVQIGVDYAQALVKGTPILIEDVMTISKGTFDI